ncbi:MAG: hypothetical protein AAB320_01200 [Elusimicrobiota bacterium]
MNIALTARITFDANRIRQSSWVHDTAHHFVKLRRRALMAVDGAARRLVQLAAVR